MTQNPLLRDYSIGIVIPKAGINPNQLAEIGKRLVEIAKVLPEEGFIRVYVPGFGLADAEATVFRALRNVLERKTKVQEIYIPMAGDHKAGVAEAIVYELQQAKRCDEIWCCPAEGQTMNSTARVAQVWRLGQQGAKATRYKMIPPWIEAPQPQQQSTQPKKVKKSWRDMFNKRSFL